MAEVRDEGSSGYNGEMQAFTVTTDFREFSMFLLRLRISVLNFCYTCIESVRLMY